MKLFGPRERAIAAVVTFVLLAQIIPASAAEDSGISPAHLGYISATTRIAPKNTKAPLVSGTTRVPNRLSVTNGTWSSAPTSYAYQWFRCTAAVKKVSASPNSSCAVVGSATSSTYTLTDDDAGKFLVARVSATNTSGTVLIHTVSTTAIIPRVIAPSNSVAGTITGTAQVSRVLTVNTGTWTESPDEYAYQWMRCTKAVSKAVVTRPSVCSAITDATESVYQLDSSDSQKYVSAAITASNTAGGATVYTKSTAAVGIPTAYSPSLFSAPDMFYSGDTSLDSVSAISGDAKLGSVLVASKGQWLGYPLPEVSYSYWYRCDLPHTTSNSTRPTDCYAISGSNGINGETYLVTANEVGKYLLFEVIATNPSGTIRYFTPTTDSVDAAPTLVSAPVQAGMPRYGQTLTVTTGRWSTGLDISLDYTYTWYRCTTNTPTYTSGHPIDCAAISGQSNSSYTLTDADLGLYVVATVTATNNYGEETSASSNVSGRVLSIPTLLTYPSVSGTRAPGEILTISEGSWVSFPSAATTYQWYRCTSQVGSVVTSQPNQCEAIPDATGSSYTQVIFDTEKFISASATRANELGSLTAWGIASRATYAIPMVTTGTYHSCAMLQFTGPVKCWGWNGWGQLGDNVTPHRTPTVVLGLSNVLLVSSGGLHTCALIDDGSVKCLGGNNYGQLGSGSIADRSSTPVTVTGVTDALSISADFGHTCALVSGGSVKCWGLNSNGQLGDGTKLNRRTPVLVSGLTNADSVSVGTYHTCAVRIGGTVSCWGGNSNGQLGDGTTLDRSAPVLVSGLSNAVSVSAGGNQTCAVIAGGSVKCWGENSKGQLGDGSTLDKLTPVTVSGVSSAVTVSTYGDHSCALLSGGSIKCWGNNEYGQLGDGTTTNRLTPVTVSGLSTVVSLSAGDGHTCAVTQNSSIFCWGKNGGSSLLGFGSDVDQQLTPISVPFG